MAFDATGAYAGSLLGSAFTNTTLDKFIPQLWMNEVTRARNSKMFMSKFVKMIPDSFKKGDTLYIPAAGNLSANIKEPETPVTLQTNTPTEFSMGVDRYMESSFFVEDIARIQDDYNAMSIYTEECGLALARDLDHWILAHRVAIKAAGGIVQARNAGDTADDVMNIAAILAAKLTLEEADVPMEDTSLIVSPAQYTTLLGIDQFINADYVENRVVSTGQVGMLYGIPVFVTNHIKKNATTGFKIGQADAGTATPGVAYDDTGAVYSDYWPVAGEFTETYHGGQESGLTAPDGTAAQGPNADDDGDTLRIGHYSAILCRKDWLAMWMQQQPKVESSREVLYQGDAVVCSQFYGAKTYRQDEAVVIESAEA